MHIRILIVLMILGLMSFPATADFTTVMEVYEVELVHLRLPATESGSLTFADCADCEALTIRVTPATVYTLNGEDVPLAEFRRAVVAVTNRKDTIVDVFHDFASNTVIRVRVKL